MNGPLRLTVVLIAVITGTASASPTSRELHGVVSPVERSASGKTLHLNGMGVRTRFVFKVYVASLYLEQPTKDARAVLTSEQVKQVRLKLLRDLDQESVVSAFRTAIEKNAGAQAEALRPKLEPLYKALRGAKNGEELVLTYVPGTGTRVEGPGTSLVLEGSDVARALFSIWLGEHPIDDGLKAHLLEPTST